jgi:hypothetical protein
MGFIKSCWISFWYEKVFEAIILIHPYKEEIYFPDIDRKLDKPHRREKALYVLLLIETKDGGINFNLPKSGKQLASYNQKLLVIQKKYQMIYGSFGGDVAPDLSQAEIRRPIVSCLKRSLKDLDGLLYNLSDYLIDKNEFGNLTVNLEENLLYMYDVQAGSMVHLFDSELYRKIKQL